MRTTPIIITALLLVAALSSPVHSQQPFINYTEADGLPDDNIYGVAIDQNNKPWFATQSGVAMFDGVNWTIYDSGDGLADDFVNCIAIAPNGDVWAGTDAGVSHLDGTTWVTYTIADGLVSNMVNHIAVAQSGMVWIATSGGVSAFDGTVFINYTIADGLPSQMIGFVSIDNDDQPWFGTWLGGAARFDGANFIVFTKDSGLIDNNITTIAFDSVGNKYLGTYFGISVLDINGNWVRDILHSDGLYHEAVMDIAFDSKGNMWVGIFVDYLLDGGITAVAGAQFWSYGVNEGLVSIFVNRIAIDHDDNVWIATGGGASEFLGHHLKAETPAGGNTFIIYPNPTASHINIETSLPESVKYSVTDLYGRIVLGGNISNGQGRLDVSALSPGCYILYVTQGDKVMNRKFIMQ